jgi:hypothetical protein
LAIVAWLLPAACSIVVDPQELERGCEPGKKKCEVTPGELRCVSTNDPAYGCARESCVPCTLAHADEVCDSGGECAIGTCIPEFQNCDLVSRNGCEIDLNTSYDNCARCGASCSDELRDMPHTVKAECFDAHCIAAECQEGYADCDLAGSNGCETALTKLAPELCGRCGGCQSGTLCNVVEQICE